MQDEQRKREADLVLAVDALEQEKETLSRGVILAQERCDNATHATVCRGTPCIFSGSSVKELRSSRKKQTTKEGNMVPGTFYPMKNPNGLLRQGTQGRNISR